MTKTMSVAQVKTHLSEVLRDLESQGDVVVVARRGRPVAVIERFRGQVSDQASGWFDRLYGCMSDVRDFGRLMTETVRARRSAGSRQINLDQDG